MVTNLLWREILSKREKTEKLLISKILYTCIIVFAYLLGRGVPLYGVDTQLMDGRIMNAEELLMHSIGGDSYQYSLMALGISPYMISTIIVQMIMSMRDSDSRSKISPRKVNRISMKLMLFIAICQSLLRIQRLPFVDNGNQTMLFVSQAIAVLEMVTGAILIIWLSGRNKKYGIGGQTALIFVNIIDGLIASVKQSYTNVSHVLVLVSVFVLVVTLVMENTEKRIPVQRISIHNIYSDKNYIAVKLNPIGVMPVMFSTAFFMIPQVILSGMNYYFPTNELISNLKSEMVLSHKLGIIVYLIIILLLTLVFSRITISPRDVAENLAKGGDSIQNLHAGKETKRYISRELFIISIISSTVMAICVGVPLFMQLKGEIDSTLIMLPSSIMMLTGIWCNLYQEIKAVGNGDSYRLFF